MGEFTFTEVTQHGVTFLSDYTHSSKVTFAFSERIGGVSVHPFTGLNLGAHVNDDLQAVEENRKRFFSAVGVDAYVQNLVVPTQVHGSEVVLIDNSELLTQRRHEAQEGADAVVCTIPNVPVMLLYADCVPVVITSPLGFAVIHSGWKGTIARISEKALQVLTNATKVPVSECCAYIGPHIRVQDYEVSHDLLERFVGEFGQGCAGAKEHLSLAYCVTETLTKAGMSCEQIFDCGYSTVGDVEKFFSYRAEGGVCGRHGALGFMHEDEFYN